MSFAKIPQAWVPPMYIHRVLANIMEHMETQGGVVPNKKPVLYGWKLEDDRGGSGNYAIRFEEGDLKVADIKRIVGNDITVTMEDL